MPPEVIRNHLQTTLGGCTVPELWNTARLWMVSHLIPRIQDGPPARTGQNICSLLDGDRPFGVVPQSQAGYAQSGGFFLNTTRIREHNAAV